jgi:hypothetical protein
MRPATGREISRAVYPASCCGEIFLVSNIGHPELISAVSNEKGEIFTSHFCRFTINIAPDKLYH